MRFDYIKVQDFLLYVERMDTVYMDHVSEKQEEMKRKSGQNATPPPPKKG